MIRIVTIVTLSLSLWALSYGTAMAQISGNYSFDYAETFIDAGGTSYSRDSSFQTLSLNINKYLTSTLDLRADLRWYSSKTDGKGTSSFYPLITLNYHPPQTYNLQFGYNIVESIPSEGERLTKSTMSASFNLPRGKYPGITLSYSRGTQEDHGSPKRIDRTTDSLRFGSDYMLDTLEGNTFLNFSMSNVSTENRITQVETEAFSYSMTASTNTRLLDGKGSFSANVGYTFDDDSLVSLAGPTLFEVIRNAFQGYWCSSCGAALSIEGGVTDSNTATVVDPSSTPAGDSIDLRVANQHVGLGFLSAQSMHMIYLYVNTTAAEEVLIPGYNFGWQLYTSPDNITWTSVPLTVTPTYDALYNRFVFDFGTTTDIYFKVVNTLSAGVQAIEVTEISGYGNLITSPQNTYNIERDNLFAGLNMSYSPMSSLSLGYNLQYSVDTTQPIDDESSTLSQGVSLAWRAIPRYLSLTTSYNTRSSDNSGGSDNSSNSYTLALSSSPLDTVTGSLSYRFSESSIDGRVTSDSGTIGLNTNVKLFTGVSFALSASATNSESYSGVGSETESKTVVGDIYLTPWSFMRMTISAAHGESESSGLAGSSNSYDNLRTNITFPLTRNLNVSTVFNITPDSSQSLSASWRPTKRLQFYVRSTFSSKARNFGADMTWRVMQQASISLGYTGTWVNNSINDKVQRFFIRGSLWF